MISLPSLFEIGSGRLDHFSYDARLRARPAVATTSEKDGTGVHGGKGRGAHQGVAIIICFGSLLELNVKESLDHWHVQFIFGHGG